MYLGHLGLVLDIFFPLFFFGNRETNSNMLLGKSLPVFPDQRSSIALIAMLSCPN